MRAPCEDVNCCECASIESLSTVILFVLVCGCNESCCCNLFFSRSCFFVTSQGGVVSISS